MASAQPFRLQPQPDEVLDRSQTFSFTFNGKKCTAYHGDTIASALVANGLRVISRSFKYHRPRGLMAFGHDSASMVQVGDEPSVSAWLRPAEPGMEVRSVNAWPSPERDLMSLVRFVDPFLPVGFYYKAFIRPKQLWPLYEKALRHVAGLGKLNPGADRPSGYYKQYVHEEVVVVGGGPAGLSAAVKAAEQGARVALFDAQPQLGGHVSYAGRSDWKQEVAKLKARASQLANLTLYRSATVLGWWEDNWLAAVSGKILYKIRAKATVFATGALDQPLVFENNDLPGVMLGSAVLRLLHLYGTAAGHEAIIVTANDDGWRVAAELIAAGVGVSGVVDQRKSSDDPLVGELTRAGVPAFWQHTIVKAEGGKQVQTALIAPISDDGQVVRDATNSLAGDLIAISVAWAPDNNLLYQAGAKITYDQERREFLPQSLPAGVFAAGRVVGTHRLSTEVAEGGLAGMEAAAFVGAGPAPEAALKRRVARDKQAELPRTSDLVSVPGSGKRFVDFDEDVTEKDVAMAIAEGYESIELLKRYSTISMGPSQGKWSSVNAIHLAAAMTGQTIAETGTTTSRPPVRPVELAALAGQHMEPVKRTPLHSWHQERGAKMMVAGLWMRPEHYGDPTAEIRAVRQRVGLIDVSTLGKLKLTGPGVPNLLDFIYVNRWQKLAVGRVRYGLMCNDEGIILDDGVTARVGQQEWYMTTTSAGVSGVFEWLQWWAQTGWGEAAHITQVSEEWAAFNLAGPLSRDVLHKVIEHDPDGVGIGPEEFPYLHARDATIAGVPCRLLRIGFTGELSFEIHCPAAYGRYLWESILAAGEEYGILPFGVEAQRVLRLEKAHIIVGQDTDALTDPISADLGWAVKIDKQDFLGKRPLARVLEAGPKQKLVGFKMLDKETVPEEGLQIVRANAAAPVGLEIIGWVTSSRFSPTLNESIGLCWLPAALAEQSGQNFTIHRQGKLLEAVVHHGPFYDPAGERLRM